MSLNKHLTLRTETKITTDGRLVINLRVLGVTAEDSWLAQSRVPPPMKHFLGSHGYEQVGRQVTLSPNLSEETALLFGASQTRRRCWSPGRWPAHAGNHISSESQACGPYTQPNYCLRHRRHTFLSLDFCLDFRLVYKAIS